MTIRRWPVYFLIALLMLSDAVIMHRLLAASQVPAAPAVETPLPLRPAVLGNTDAPLTIRGESPALNQPDIPTPSRPLDVRSITARSFLVYDSASGVVLAERNSREKRSIASITKLMTALVVYHQLGLEASVEVVPTDLVTERPVLGLRPGDVVSSGELFNAMLVGSANDAAAVLAGHIERQTGVAFSILMNNEAKRLGMRETNFSNPLGFDSQSNYSSAHDVALLVDESRSYTAFSLLGRVANYSLVGEQGVRYTIQATNKLVSEDPEIAAIKTGYTLDAQGAMVTAITHEGRTVIVIVLGSADREGDTRRLKNAVFDSYVWR